MDTKQQSNAQNILYELHDNSLLSKRYYGIKYDKAKKMTTWLNISIAFLTGLAFFTLKLHYDAGKSVVDVILGSLTIFALVRPHLKLEQKMETYHELSICYSRLSNNYGRIIDHVKIIGAFSDQDLSDMNHLRDEYARLSDKDDVIVNAKLLDSIRSEIIEGTKGSRHCPDDDADEVEGKTKMDIGV